MKKNDILNKLIIIAHQPYLIFSNQVEKKYDNAFETLKLIGREEEVTAGRIAEYLDIKPSSVTQIVKKLEDAGTAKRVKSENDARVTFVELTDKGRESISAQRRISSDFKDEVFKGFTEEDLDIFNEYLNRIYENVSSDEFNEKLNDIFGDDKMCRNFKKMSAHLSRAREQMLDNHFGRKLNERFQRGFGENIKPFRRGDE